MPDTRHTATASPDLSFVLGLAKASPWKLDLFMLLRWIDAKQRNKPRFGMAIRPRDEAVRIGQTVSLQFAPTNVDSVIPRDDGSLAIHQRGFGLFGPNGPLPIHLTEYALERAENFRDRSITAFADIFHHRSTLLFYRAWAQVQPTVSMDHADADRFSAYVSSLIGFGETSQQCQDTVPDSAKRYSSGHFVRQTRNPEGLVSTLIAFFGCEFSLVERCFQWLSLRGEDRTALGDASTHSRLGLGAICGASVPDRSHRFRLRVGPLSLASYEKFLPSGNRYIQLRDWVRNYVGFEFSWDACLVLSAAEVPALALGGTPRLGWTTWLGTRKSPADADDLVLDIEARFAN